MKTVLCFVLGVFAIAPAFAGSYCTHDHDHDLDLPCAVDETDYYLGLGFGRTNSSTQPSGEVAPYYGMNTLTFGKRFAEDFAYEWAYAQPSTFSNLSIPQTYNVNVLSLSVLGKLSLDPKQYFSVYGKMGYAASIISVATAGNYWHGDFIFGYGLEYSPFKARDWYLRAGVDEYYVGLLSPVSPHLTPSRNIINVSSLSLLYNF